MRKHLLPWKLIWLARKGRKDCGNHDWYNADGRVENCMHCKAGVREYSRDHFN
jgi:hypothetical protein